MWECLVSTKGGGVGRPSIKMKVYSLISVRAQSRCLVVLLAIDVCAVVERLVSPPHWPSPFLVLKEEGEEWVAVD